MWWKYSSVCMDIFAEYVTAPARKVVCVELDAKERQRFRLPPLLEEMQECRGACHPYENWRTQRSRIPFASAPTQTTNRIEWDQARTEASQVVCKTSSKEPTRKRTGARCEITAATSETTEKKANFGTKPIYRAIESCRIWPWQTSPQFRIANCTSFSSASC